METDRTRDVVAWAEKLQPFLQKCTHVFGYFSKFYSGYPVGDAEEFLRCIDAL